MTGLKKNISNKVNHHLRLKGLCKTRGSARVKATEALLSNFQSVVECLEEESENSETNSKSLFQARCLIKSLNWVLFLNLIWWNKIPQIIDVVSRLLQSKSNDLFLVVQSFQSVVDKLSVLRTRDQYNAFVTEAKTVGSNFDIFTDVLGPAEFPKRTKKMPLQVDENTGGISLSEEDKHRTIYFETLDNMIGELNERMNGFSKVLDLFYFLNPNELKKLNIEDVKRNTSAERAMSVLRRLKNYLRSTMVQNRISNLALLSMEYEAAQDLNMTELIDKFSKAKVRRVIVSKKICWAAQKLLKQTVLDQAISVVFVSEQLRNPMEDANWVSSDDNRCAVVAVGHSAPPIEDRGSGTGFAWIKLGSLVIYSCYYTPNCSVAEFEEYLSRLEDSIRVHRDCQVVVGGT
ncbi:hypothetical protein QTP88_013628 [Uroleucon formosanum]